MVDADRAARQLTNLAAHLNERHPDTVAFLARCASGGVDVLSAELVADWSGELSALARVAGEPASIRVPLLGPAVDDHPRARLGELLASARAAVGDAEPLTSLELQMRGGHGH